MKEFFRDLLFDTPGAFTLFGTKPVSSVYISPPKTEEEKKKIREMFPEARERESHFAENYKKWKEIQSRFPIRRYLFGSFQSSFAEGGETLLFVNIESTLQTLLTHYTDFRRVLGFDFDPFQVVFDVKNRESPFWNAILKHASLYGIVLGFEQMDSWLFDWSRFYDEEKDQKGEFLRSLPVNFSSDTDILYPTPDNFSIPMFRTFDLSTSNQLIKKYKHEQIAIKDIYRGQDEVDVALGALTK